MMKSHRLGRRIASAVAAGCVGLTLASAAGAVDLRDWGRKLPTSERFVVLSQFTYQAVLDKETQLVWQRTPFAASLSWVAAFHSCLYASMGGRQGWRLPTWEELASLKEQVSGGVYALPSAAPFTGVPPVAIWTATTDPANADKAGIVSLTNSTVGVDLKTSNRPFMCVRGGHGHDGR